LQLNRSIRCIHTHTHTSCHAGHAAQRVPAQNWV